MTTPSTGRIEQGATGRILAIERTFTAAIGDVWASITEPERTARWVGPWTGDPITGPIAVTWTAEAGAPVEYLRVLECVPPSRLVVLTDGDGAEAWHIELSLVEHDGSTTLTLRQRLSPTISPSTVGPGWEFYLDRLTAARAGREPAPFTSYSGSVEAHYAALD